jgi:hypothetical protein
MASERQIAANRRNASKSAGPRSQSGKSRASRNAYRHGLSRTSTNTAFAKQVKHSPVKSRAVVTKSAY